MKRLCHFVVVALVAAQAITIGQGADVAKLLASVRAALGGEDKIAAVKSLAASGHTTRVSESGASPATDFEIGMELPDKFYKKDTIGVVMGSTLTRTTGFNGSGLIEIMDNPPAMGSGGNVQMFRVGPGMTNMGGQSTPEQTAEQRKAAPKFLLAGDGVHVNEQGQWLIAREVLRELGAADRLVAADDSKALTQS